MDKITKEQYRSEKKRVDTVAQVVSCQPEDVVPINVGREVISESVQVETTLYVIDAEDFSAVLKRRRNSKCELCK